jgi:ankyrin repeat protein
MSTILPLSEICAEQAADPRDQRQRLLALLAAGADVQAADKNGVTALHHAVRFRSAAAVRTLLEHGADLNQACRKSGSTPLHRAVLSTGAPGTAGKQAAAREIVQLLLAAGADPSLCNKQGKTPGDYVKDEEVRRMLAGNRKKVGK